MKTLQFFVIEELQKNVEWLRKNKLSLNYSKTNCLLISNHPYKKLECNFTVSINSTSINRTDSVKRLGVYLDDMLNWYITHLSLQLARYSVMFYRLRKLVPPLGFFKIWKIFKILCFRIFFHYMDPKIKFCENFFFKNRITPPCAKRLKFLQKLAVIRGIPVCKYSVYLNFSVYLCIKSQINEASR